MRTLFLTAMALVFALPASPQLFSGGIKAGVPLTDPFQSICAGNACYSNGVRRYVIGPTAEVHLPFRLSVEVDALYRRVGYDASFGSGNFSLRGSFRSTGSDWQIPFLAKYTFRSPLIYPFIDVGVTYRHVSLSPSSLANPNTAGISLGGGLGLKLLLLRLSPEIRYTHFPTNIFDSTFSFIKSSSNQADFLVGFTF